MPGKYMLEVRDVNGDYMPVPRHFSGAFLKLRSMCSWVCAVTEHGQEITQLL